MTNMKQTPLSGIVTARNCPVCGHHEIGLVSDDGVFHPLRPGARVLVANGDETAPASIRAKEARNFPENLKKPPLKLEGRYWVPEPIEGDRQMRMKYGAVIPDKVDPHDLNGQMYESAFLQKLHYLLEKEPPVPIAVTLDRFFVAPHLASGETKDIVNRMWQELEEIRRPVELMIQWLDNPDEKNLKLLVQPGDLEDLEKNPVSEERELAELHEMELEDFLNLL